MKNSKYLLLGFFILALAGLHCKKENGCLRVTYVDGYCFKRKASQVYFDKSLSFTLSSNSGSNGSKVYAAALINIPEEFRVRGKVFYVKVHYDKELDVIDPIACPANIAPSLKVAVCDWAGDSCD